MKQKYNNDQIEYLINILTIMVGSHLYTNYYINSSNVKKSLVGDMSKTMMDYIDYVNVCTPIG